MFVATPRAWGVEPDSSSARDQPRWSVYKVCLHCWAISLALLFSWNTFKFPNMGYMWVNWFFGNEIVRVSLCNIPKRLNSFVLGTSDAQAFGPQSHTQQSMAGLEQIRNSRLTPELSPQPHGCKLSLTILKNMATGVGGGREYNGWVTSLKYRG